MENTSGTEDLKGLLEETLLNLEGIEEDIMAAKRRISEHLSRLTEASAASRGR